MENEANINLPNNISYEAIAESIRNIFKSGAASFSPIKVQ